MSQMLDTLAKQGLADPNTLMDALVASGKISAERRQLLALMMQPAPAADLDIDDDADFMANNAIAESDDAHPYDHRQDRRDKMQEMMLASAERIEWLEAMTDRLGRALGACPDCFGTLPDCSECDGDGAPGSYRPSRMDFNTFVLPVLNRMRLGRARASKSVVADPQEGQHIDHPKRRD